jgi:uncharacterized membrane protein
LVTRILVGVGLIVIWVDVPILALVIAGSWAMSEFERIMAVVLLKEDIPRSILKPAVNPQDDNLSSAERVFVGV